MANQYTTEVMIALLNNLQCIARSENTYTDVDLVMLLNDGLVSYLLPQFLEVKEEFFVTSLDYEVDQNTLYIELPEKAIGMAARDVYWVGRNTGAGINNLYRLTLIQPEALGNLAYNGVVNNYASGTGMGYYLEGNRIVFFPQINTSGTIKVKYFRQPNTLTTIDQAGKIVSIDTGTNIVTLDTAPDTDTWTIGTILDAIHQYQPFNFAAEEIEIVDRNGLDFEFSTDVIALLRVGDYLTDTGFSVFLQYFPNQALNLLTQAAAMKLLEGLGDIDNFKVASAVYNAQRDGLFKIIKDRVQGQPKIIPRTGSSMFNPGAWNNGFYNGGR